MKQLMGVINLVHEPDDLEELTIYRNTACVPFGGRYRLIDFMLSNMVNSGIGNVAVFTHHKYRSLMDHLGSGKEWDLDRKRGGLFLLPSLGDGSNGTAREICSSFILTGIFLSWKRTAGALGKEPCGLQYSV
nr:sugar phosphate nucleotidyltransferase [Paenibacillus larvae]